MYQPAHHREDRLEVQHALMRAFPLATLVTNGASGLIANHVPFLIDPERSRLGTLRAHIARANPQWREFDAGAEALVMFQGPERYVTPVLVRDEAADRQGRADLELRRRPRLRDHAGDGRRGVAAHADRRPHPLQRGGSNGALGRRPTRRRPSSTRWCAASSVSRSRSPASRASGRSSQNRPEADREGVVEGLRAEADERADAMAELVEAFGAKG